MEYARNQVKTPMPRGNNQGLRILNNGTMQELNSFGQNSLNQSREKAFDFLKGMNNESLANQTLYNPST